VALIKENEGSGRGCVKLKEAVYGKMNSENSYRQFLTYAKVFNPRLSFACLMYAGREAASPPLYSLA
jgi:hypothetical protein